MKGADESKKRCVRLSIAEKFIDRITSSANRYEHETPIELKSFSIVRFGRTRRRAALWQLSFSGERKEKIAFTCRWNASGIVNVLEIQQNVLTTCVGRPLTMHEMGCPTYWVAVITKLHDSSSTVVNTLCRRNTALSICTSGCLKYSFSPPNSLYMIHFDYFSHCSLVKLSLFGTVRFQLSGLSSSQVHSIEIFGSRGSRNEFVITLYPSLTLKIDSPTAERSLGLLFSDLTRMSETMAENDC